MSVEQWNFMSVNEVAGTFCEKPQGNITHLGQNLNKLQKSNKVLEKNLGSLTLQITEANKQLLNMKIESGKLRKQLEKSENHRKSLNGVLSKMSDEMKQKDEIIKKHVNYITKLESQLIKGNLHMELIEGNKKLEEKVSLFERDIKEFEALNQALKTKLVHQDKQMTILNSCLQINLNEFFRESNQKLSIEQMTEILSSKQRNEEVEKMFKDLENLQILSDNNKLEIVSYKEALRQSYAENQTMRKNLEELLKNQENENLKNEIRALKQEKNQYFNEYTSLRVEIEKITGRYNLLLEEKTNLEQEMSKMEETLKEYKELVTICEEVFTGDFEGILKESLGIIIEKKAMKQKIHDIVQDCTSKLLGEDL